MAPFDRETSQKNEICSFRPVSRLANFSKILENVAERSPEPYVNNLLFPFLFASRKNYRTQQVLENGENDLIKSMLKEVPSRAFEGIPHNFLLTTLDAYGFNKIWCITFINNLKNKAVYSYD